jgi:hypothetical protein
MTRGGSDGEHRSRREYNGRRRGRYDNGEDRSQSLTPDPRGLRAFGVNVLTAAPPARYRAPTTIAKYDGQTNLSV